MYKIDIYMSNSLAKIIAKLRRICLHYCTVSYRLNLVWLRLGIPKEVVVVGVSSDFNGTSWP